MWRWWSSSALLRVTKASLEKGRRAEQAVARMLSAWAEPCYTFRRRGLGHAGVADIIAVSLSEGPRFPAWPFVISVKSEEGPTLASMLVRARHGQPWGWWQELELAGGGWLIWRSSRVWLISCATLGALEMPPRLAILPHCPGWPPFTMHFAELLAVVPIGAAVAAIADGWGPRP